LHSEANNMFTFRCSLISFEFSSIVN